MYGRNKRGERRFLYSTRAQIRKSIKIAYDIRSTFVHGQKINWEKIKSKNEIDLRAYDFVEQVLEYVRQSIRRFLALIRKYGLTRKKHENFLRVVDSSIHNEKPMKEYLVDE